MYFYKIGRIELLEQIKKHSHHIIGKTLEIGAGGYSRYQHLFKSSEYLKMDIEESTGIDIVGDITNIPMADNSFDSIVCTQVLGDVFELDRAMSEMYRLLRPGGTLLLTESFFDPLHDEPHDFWRFTPHSLRSLAEKAGFKILEIEGRGGYYSVRENLRVRYHIENINKNPLGVRVFNFLNKIKGKVAQRLDRMDRKNKANQLFAHGYILIAKKDA